MRFMFTWAQDQTHEMNNNVTLLIPIDSNRLESIGNGSKYRNKAKNIDFYDDYSQFLHLEYET